MARFESFIIQEEWNIKPTRTASDALAKYRGGGFPTLVFIYLPKLDMFIHMQSETGEVFVNNTKLYTIKDKGYRHHDSMALKVMSMGSEFKEYDAVDLYERDAILKQLEDDFDSVRGFAYKNDIYVYDTGGIRKYKSKAIMKLKTYIDDMWWEKGLDEEWKIKTGREANKAIWKYRNRDNKTLVFLYIPKPDMFVSMDSEVGDVYVNNRKIGHMEGWDNRHHESIAALVMNKVPEFSAYDADELYQYDEILETLESDYNLVRGFCLKNTIYIYDTGGADKFSSQTVMKIKTHLDEDWWTK